MIENIQISGVHEAVDEDLQKYIIKKIGHLDKYLSRKVRQSVHAEVKLKESRSNGKKQHTCEVILRLPKEVITTKETTMNVYAAVDIVEAKLLNQLRKYKQKHNPVRLRQRFVARLRHTAR